MDVRNEVVVEPPKNPEYWRMAKEQYEIAKGNAQALPRFTSYRAGFPTKPSNVGDHISILQLEDLVTLHRIFLELSMMEQLAGLKAKIREEGDFVRTEAYLDILLPYLREHIRLAKSYNFRLDDKNDQALFKDVLYSYLLRCVQLEPSKPTTWAQMRREGCAVERPEDCDCYICDDLIHFLESDRQTKRFAYNIPQRAHIEKGLGLKPKAHSEHADYITMTEKSGTPHKLVVQKTDKAFRRTHREWLLRRREGRRQILIFLGSDDAELRTLLGDQYEYTVHFKLLQCAPCRPREPSEPDPADFRAILLADPTSLLYLKEPRCTAQWLRLRYVQDASSSVYDWQLADDYQQAFEPEEPTRSPRLSKDELFELAEQVFRSVARGTTDRSHVLSYGQYRRPLDDIDGLGERSIKGIRLRKVQDIGLPVVGADRTPLADVTNGSNVSSSGSLAGKRKHQSGVVSGEPAAKRTSS
ncbi:hypothetical protein LTR15_001853 [Elasticomyces elasticus]|nr:hypothetical protein LTR15_001853 [Elasticomyces elasticus]